MRYDLIFGAVVGLLVVPLAAAANCPPVSDLSPTCVIGDFAWNENCVAAIEVWEDCPIGTPIFTSAEDATLESWGCSEYFGFEGNILKVKSTLDAEDRTCQSHTGGLEAAGYESATLFFFQVDVNESPVSTDITPSTYHIEENMSEVISLVSFNVKDDDYGEIDTLTFDLQPADRPFELVKGSCDDNSCGFELKTTGPLDYEDIFLHALTLTFTTTDPRGDTSSVSVPLSVYVVDQADTPPRWTSPDQRRDIKETDQVPVFVAKVKAVDGDSSINNAIRYSIAEGNEEGYFSIDETTGEITTLKPLDRDDPTKTASFVLTVKAEELNDQGGVAEEPNSSTTTVTVEVKDVNDNSPKFAKPTEEVTIPELTSGSVSVLEVTVNDPDLVTPRGRTVTLGRQTRPSA